LLLSKFLDPDRVAADSHDLVEVRRPIDRFGFRGSRRDPGNDRLAKYL
jgi:hypothetical protein